LGPAAPRDKKKVPAILAIHFPQTAAFLNQLWREGLGHFAACEQGLLAALKHDGAKLLEGVLNDPDLPCQGQQARLGEQDYGRRAKSVLSLLGRLTLWRPYYYDPRLGQGRFPLDEALGLVDGYSPEVARWMCRAGSLAGSYEAASLDLLTYAHLEIDGRQIQRMIEQMAPQLATWRDAQAATFNPLAGEIFCVCADGTGAPMRRPELHGRKGKQPDGTARTREVKVGALFTHRRPKPEERPVRDYHATTYIAHITSAPTFGAQLRAEALRRGIAKAKITVFLGDGAVWIWKLARINFPNAVYILDYYHALEHLALLTQALYGEGSVLAKRRFRQWRKALLKDRVGQVIAQAKQDLPSHGSARRSAQKQIAYLERNRSKMLYQTYRQAGYFIGSGVVEAACKSVVGQRLKQSGMLWSLKGAGHILTVRCALLSGWFDDFWNHRHTISTTSSVAPN